MMLHPMDPYLRAAREAVDAAAGDLPLDLLGRAVDGRWSIAEILEHLTLAFAANAAALERALASGERRARPPVLRQRFWRFVVVDLGYFPRVKAPEKTRPSGSIPAERSREALRDALDRLDVALTRVADRFGSDVAVANHPYLGGFSVRHWRKFHWRHTVHHMRQVRRRT
jgi:hypothetical protein